MHRLLKVNLPNVMLLIITVFAILSITSTAHLAVKREVLDVNESDMPWGVVMCVGIMLIHYVIIKAAPSTLRWVWFWIVAAWFALVAVAPLLSETETASYDGTSVRFQIIMWVIILGPLFRFRLTEPKRRVTQK